jgi:glycosyltransferase involved in cell wall biosynthesis
MKITHVISDSNVGGAGVLLCRILEGLSDEFDEEAVLPEGSALCTILPRGVRVTQMPIAKDASFRRSDIAKLRRHFSATRPDVLHTHASFSARVAGRLEGVPTLLSTRHCAKGQVSRSPLYRTLYDRVTDLTVSTALFATQNLIREGVPANKTITIPNGSPERTPLSFEERMARRASLGVAPDDFLLGSVARLETVKGQDLMIEALARLLPAHENLYLLLVGDGSAAPLYKRLSEELGVSHRVLFIGYVKDAFPYQNLIDLNLNASRGTETTCLATSECMSLGIPTVASDFGGNPEMIRDGESGLLFPSEDLGALVDAIHRVVIDRRLYHELSLGARRAFEDRFSLSRMLERYRRLYRSLAHKSLLPDLWKMISDEDPFSFGT